MPANSALVLVDQATMDVLGQEPYAMRWPFPRMAFAALVVALHQSGAERIVLDFTFFDQSEAVEQDALLAGTAAAIPSVFLARTKDQLPKLWDATYQTAHPQFFQTPRLGNADLVPDEDGVVRVYAAADSLAAITLGPQSSAGLVHWYGGLERIRSRGVPVLAAYPFVEAGLPILRRLSETAPDGNPDQIAAALKTEPLLHGATAESVRGRTVFVGANVRGTFDRTPFPVGEIEPGVLLHWTAWGNLQSGGFVQPLSRSWSLLVGCAVAIVLFATGQQRTSLNTPGIAALGFSVTFFGVSYLAINRGVYFAPSTPAVASFLALMGVAADSFWTEQKRKREIQNMFSSYVAPEVVDLLMRDPKAIELGGERRVATVLFSDLVGFTELSEKLPPDELLATVNAYLQEVSSCMLQHGAYIDKYIGDAVMAVFGVPLALPDDAVAACHAALAAQDALERLNRGFVSRGLGTLAMRIGINTGSMIVGNLGSARKKNYTVLGDSVNLASRLEGANKEFGTSILLGPETAARATKEFAVRPLTHLQVKGKQVAVEVFELLGRRENLTGTARDSFNAYCEGYALLKQRRFTEAKAALTTAIANRPDDGATLRLLKQLAQCEDRAPEAGWQPHLKMETK